MRRHRIHVVIAGLLAVALYSIVDGHVGVTPAAPSQTKAMTPHFVVEWGGSAQGFVLVSGLDSKVAVLEYRSGIMPSQDAVKMAGKPTYANLVLRNPASDMAEMWSWYKLSLQGKPERRDVTVSILNTQHEPVISYKLKNAWPCAWRGPILTGDDKQIAMEEVEIAYESMQREGE